MMTSGIFKYVAVIFFMSLFIIESPCQERSDKKYKKYSYKAVHRVKDFETNQNFIDQPVKNIILMIGDGMGTSQIFAGLVANKGKLNLSYFPVTGFQLTNSINSIITDSAAGATAMATGEKTNNSMISVDPQGIPIETILEIAEKRNLSTGLVATSTITHATPAAFIAHNYSRNNYEAIASDFLKTDVDVFIGGGEDHFNKRLDNSNLLETLSENGYNIVTSPEELETYHGGKLAGLLFHEAAPSIVDGRGDMLSLASSKALEIVKKNNAGFFLMIEGSQIDWGNHQNDVYYQTEEMLDFDKVIGEILEFAINDGETLVIVTADHETGGLAINGGNMHEGKVKGAYTTTGHTAVMVPVFAYGPKQELFKGIYDNTNLFDKMIEAYGWENPGK